jgi:Rad3-related DNA helicase
VFTEYKREAMTERGALLMAVCRGRLAEGIDFKDELARAIFIVAVPNLSYVDIEIKLKKKFLEKR